MRKQTLREREIFLALFETSVEDAGWNALRRDALDYLTAHPPMAVSLLAMGVNLLSWPETAYQEQRKGAHFLCQARQGRPEGAVDTGMFRSFSRKAAQQAAAVALCHLLCGSDPPPNIQEPTSETSAKVTAASVTTPSFDWSCVQPLAESGSYAGALQEACARTRQRKPRLVFTVVRAEKAQEWKCEAQVVWEGAEHSVEAVAPTKKEAGNQACEMLMKRIAAQE